MTIDGSEDDHIKVQGLTEKYTFTDADGGAEGGESDNSEDEDELADVPLGERAYYFTMQASPDPAHGARVQSTLRLEENRRKNRC